MSKKTKSTHFFISAGEASGDMHAAAIMRALKLQTVESSITAIAGPAMRSVGCDVLEPMESLNVMGIGDVLKALPRIKRVGKKVCDWAESERPDVAILVDFPGFNMRLGEKLRQLGIPVLYYIAPKLWAWGSWRVKRLKRAQDCLACILPFEPAWFLERGVQATYVGNPSAQACRAGWSEQEFRQALMVDSDQLILALLPGSRKSELLNHTQLLADTFIHLKNKYPQLVGVTARAPGVSDDQLTPLLDVGVKVIERLDENYALRVDAAIAVSGTATLELALWNTPTVLVYKGSALTIWLARKLVGTRCAGLANILLDDQFVMPELIQEQATVEKLLAEVSPLLEKQPAARMQQASFEELRQRLGQQDPSFAVAKLALSMHKS
ncbi:MAG: lipid-A-disaccharide synthase [Mariprofundaceae bacterium]